jgi:hypothetical protein
MKGVDIVRVQGSTDLLAHLDRRLSVDLAVANLRPPVLDEPHGR